MRNFTVKVNGVAYSVSVQEEGVVVSAASSATAASVTKPAAAPVNEPVVKAVPAEVGASDTPLTAPMPGKITKIVGKVGSKVNKGDIILILEAMKMQNEIGAPVAGTLKSVNVNIGQSVKPGEIMAVIG